MPKLHAKTALPALLLSSVLALSACAGPNTTPQPGGSTPNPARMLGLYELQVNGLSGQNSQASVRPVNRITAQANEIPFNQLTFERTNMINLADAVNHVIHMTATFRVTNNTGADITLPTFIPVDADSPTYSTDGSTPFRNVRTRTGTGVSATGMQVEQSYQNSGGIIQVDPNATPLNSNLDTGGLVVSLPDGSVPAGISHQGWQTSVLANGASQLVTLAASVPMQGSDISDSDPFSFSLVFAVADNPGTLPVSLTNIASIQGSTPSGDMAAALTGTQTVEGILTNNVQTFANGLKGFFLQEEGMDSDGNANTSDGIFVYCGATCPNNDADPTNDLAVGDRVRVTGTAGDFQNQTQLSGTLTLTKLSSGVPLPAPVELSLPLPTAQREKYEGMRVHVTGIVNSNYQLGRGGLVDIADSRPISYTQDHAPDVAGFTQFNADLADRTIRIDDGSTASNESSVEFARNGGPLSVTNILRTGDSADVTGVLGYGWDGWAGSLNQYRIHALPNQAIFTGPDRPAAPAVVGGDLRVASMNIENFFTTLQTSNSGCTPNGFDPLANGSGGSARGAVNCDEYTRKVNKLLNVFGGLNGDVIGLNELQNYGKYATETKPTVQVLVEALNNRFGADTYAAVLPGRTIGGDVIAVGYIYKKAAVTPVGKLAVLDNTFNTSYTDSCNRPAMAQTFQSNSNGGRFTMVVVHLKSKGSACSATADADILDGQGAGYTARLNAANLIHSWLATDPTGTGESDVVVMGDMNSYLAEPPVKAILNGPDGTAGTADDFISQFAATSYSYQYNGSFGSLDHAFASPSFNSQVVGKTKWHINSDETVLYKSDFEFKNVAGCERTPCTSPDPYSDGPFASSDHDPILLGVTLSAQTPLAPSVTLTPATANQTVTVGGGSVTQSFTASNMNTSGDLTITVTPQGGAPALVSAPATVTNDTPFNVTILAPTGTTPGTYTYEIKAANGTLNATSTLTVTVNAAPVSSIALTTNNVTVTAGNTTTSAVTVNRTNYLGDVQLTASTSGTGAPTVSITVQPGLGNNGTVNVDATSATAGTYTVTVAATGTGVSDSKTFSVTVNTVPTGLNHLVISQVYGGGNAAGASYQSDFVEIFNPTSTAINLAGSSVQYASATGTGNFAKAVDLTGTLQPGQYYLIKLATGTAGTSPLPAADATGTTNMSGTAGKVILANTTTALACNGGSTVCTATQLAQIIDLVGFGTANFFEGTAAAPTTSITTSALRVNNGCTDNNQNSTDFTAGAPTPRNTSSPVNVCTP